MRSTGGVGRVGRFGRRADGLRAGGLRAGGLRAGVGAVVAVVALLAGCARPAADETAAFPEAVRTGPSSSHSPYLRPLTPGVEITSLLTAGDGVGGYRLVGKPDGLGAYDNGDGTFTLLVNHELGATAGMPRAHGFTGAFVSRWVIRASDLSVLSGSDLIRSVTVWDPATGSYRPATGPLAGFCSSDLAAASAFYDAATGSGYPGRILLGGEETGPEGRALAHLLDGTSWQLPRLGRAAFENQVANPGSGARTVVVGTDDAMPGQLYVYVGSKQATGTPIERAGLTNGALYGVAVAGHPLESRATPIPAGTRFGLAAFGDVSAWTGARLQQASVGDGVTQWLRPEDAAWDPRDPRVLYVATTDQFDGQSRLWRLTFDDPTSPESGGVVTALLEGTEGQHMLDNLTVTAEGRVIVQEDTGGAVHLARVWAHTPGSRVLLPLAQHDPARFTPGAPGFLTQDEETSGVIDVSAILGPGAVLVTTQAHYPLGGELVEGGQLQLLRVHWRSIGPGR